MTIAERQPDSRHPLRWPASDTMQVPFELFTDTALFVREQEQIFRGPHWSFAGLECEISEPGAYKSTYIGDTPIVVTRSPEGVIHAWVNRCAHRGAQVCRERLGKSELFTCVYHQWAYDHAGNLLSVPFRRGVGGLGGMPADFELSAHGLTKLRVSVYRGLIFVTFAPPGAVAPLDEYLGPELSAMFDRIFNRPLRLLGDDRQVMHGNWKLYAENTRDAYHGSLLHLFHATFGTYRASQQGRWATDISGRHSLIMATRTETADQQATAGLRTYQAGQFTLEDPSLLAGRPDYQDNITLVIAAVFPNLVVHQIANSLAVRMMIPRGVDQMELVWTYFGYADDDDEMTGFRMKQMNLVGPGGFISMEDGEAIELVQQGVVRDGHKASYIALGGKSGGARDNLINEASIIGFWRYYRSIMGFDA